jgi:hypothetical protein
MRPTREKQKTGVMAPTLDSPEKSDGIKRDTRQSSQPSVHDFNTQYCKNQKHWLDHAVFVTTLLAAGGAIAAAIFTGWQASIANEELKATQRPWVGVEIIDHGGVELDNDFRFAIRLHNYGRTPAVRVHITPTGLNWRPGLKDAVSEMQKKMCELGSSTPPMGFGPFILFPDQEHVENSGIRMFHKEAIAQDNFQGALFPYVLGCITYKSTFDDTIHRTPYAVQITRRGNPEAKDNSPELNAIMIDKMPIPANMISLRRESSQGTQPD